MWRVLSGLRGRDFPLARLEMGCAVRGADREQCGCSSSSSRRPPRRVLARVAFGWDWTSNESILVWLVSVFFNMACRALAFDPR